MSKTDYLELDGKVPYEAPTMLVVEVKSEGVICVSLPGYDEEEW